MRERMNGTEQKSRREKGPREARSCGVMEGRMWALWVSMDAAVVLLGTWKISCEGRGHAVLEPHRTNPNRWVNVACQFYMQK